VKSPQFRPIRLELLAGHSGRLGKIRYEASKRVAALALPSGAASTPQHAAGP
jgi:hypothetical protein